MISKLDYILKTYKAHIYNTPALHGFFTSVLCTPSFMMSDNDMAIKIFGYNEIIWYKQEDQIHFIQETTKLWNKTLDILDLKLAYSPIYYKDTKNQPIIEDWIIGFAEGILSLPDFWNILIEDEDNQELLRPIITLYNSDKLPSNILKDTNKYITRPECIKLLHTNIPKIYKNGKGGATHLFCEI